MKILGMILMVLLTNCNDYNKAESDQAEVNLIASFNDTSGTYLGDCFVKYSNEDQVFKNLSIVKQTKSKRDTLFKVDGISLYSIKGLDTEVSSKGFNGYKVVLVKPDYIVLVMVDEYGDENSDDITIEWNYYELMFEVLKTP